MTGRIKITDAGADPLANEPMPFDQSLEWVSPFERMIDLRVKIFFAQSAYSGCIEHTASDKNEVGGLLVGQVRSDPMCTRPYLLIEHILPALDTHSGQTFVTFTQETLVKLHGDLETRFPGKRIVGWYHTHPGLGVFMSSYDTWLHEHFFTDPTQVALVIDPRASQGGFFGWQTSRRLDPTHYVGFYEWGDVGEQSVMVWENLEPVLDEYEQEPEAEASAEPKPASEESGPRDVIRDA
jgi:proteasome lid subunit RPN8/RPN11